MRVLVTGGSGFIGAHVVRVLLDRQHAVRCLVRAGSRLDNLAGLPVEVAEGDLVRPGTLPAAVASCDWVMHCAADYRLGVRDPDALYRVNVEGTRNLLQAAADAGVTRFVHTSSVGALGLHADRTPANETSPVQLDDMIGHYKRSKFLAERVAEEWAARGLPVVIVNPSTPVGEMDIKPTPTGRIIVDFLRRRLPAYVDTGLNLVDVRDVAAGHLLAAEHGVPGDKYILGHENMTLREMLAALAEITGLPAPRWKLPGWLPWMAAGVSEATARLRGGTPAVSFEAVRMSRHHMYFDAGKAVTQLGLPQEPVRQALARAVDWFREQGRV